MKEEIIVNLYFASFFGDDRSQLITKTYDVFAFKDFLPFIYSLIEVGIISRMEIVRL